MTAILANTEVVRATLLFALVLALAAFAFWLVTKLRDGAAGDTSGAHNDLTKFRELHARGGLSDDEYRTIKTKLAAELGTEAGDSATED
ncbi:MAG: hypothetical protein AAGF31_01580 [Planctomycetota bacterium]